jgi:outer membrane biosynthesis protein TonB
MKLAVTLALILTLGLSVAEQQSHPASVGFQAQILSDTAGVDFNAYVEKLLSTLKDNWIHAMPESARTEEKGVVFTTFQIYPDGSVRAPDPVLERTSGKKALDDAAMAAIRASIPFTPLPSQFHGPYLRLRIMFVCNLKKTRYVPVLLNYVTEGILPAAAIDVR